MSSVADMDILLEEEADRRRVVEEDYLAKYVATVKDQIAEVERASQEQRRAARDQANRERREALADRLEKVLRLSVDPERVRTVQTGDMGEEIPVAYFGGVTFSYRERQHGRWHPHIVVSRPCVVCENKMWVEADSPTELVRVLESESRHEWDCREAEDDEPAEQREYISPVDRYKNAVRARRELQFARAKEKEMAIRRIVANKGVTFNGEAFVAGSATAAEKLVEFDADYASTCLALTEAVVEEIAARAAMQAAGFRPSREDEET